MTSQKMGPASFPRWECWRDGHKRVSDGGGAWHCEVCGYTYILPLPNHTKKKGKKDGILQAYMA